MTIQIPKREGKELRFADLSPIITEENQMIVEGRAVVFNQPTVLFKMDGNEYHEVIEPGALEFLAYLSGIETGPGKQYTCCFESF